MGHPRGMLGGKTFDRAAILRRMGRYDHAASYQQSQFLHWFRSPPKIAAKFAEQSPRESLGFCQAHYPELEGEVCSGWMRKDAAACLEWIGGQSVKVQKEILKTLMSQPDVSADAVRRFVALREPGEDCDAFAPGLSSIARRNVSLAQSLIDELFTNPIDRILLREQVVDAFASADPRRALDFLMPSLREPLPINHGPPLPQKMAPGQVYQQSPGFGKAYSYLEFFLVMGPQAGVTKEEVLRLMSEIHPQHRHWMMDGNGENLVKILGRPAEWMPQLCEELLAMKCSACYTIWTFIQLKKW